jgi:uncharacterized protein (DUF1697 family)
METYLALLRGINVGGKNIIRMIELGDFFRAIGFSDVRTYIQSGNVIFCSHEPDPDRLTRLLEESLSKTFDYESRLLLRSYEDMKQIVRKAPRGFGSEPSLYRYDVIFLREPLRAAELIKALHPKEGVDKANAGEGVAYISRLIERAAQSGLTRINRLPLYQDVTIRNWNTTTRLMDLMKQMAA